MDCNATDEDLTKVKDRSSGISTVEKTDKNLENGEEYDIPTQMDTTAVTIESCKTKPDEIVNQENGGNDCVTISHNDSEKDQIQSTVESDKLEGAGKITKQVEETTEEVLDNKGVAEDQMNATDSDKENQPESLPSVGQNSSQDNEPVIVIEEENEDSESIVLVEEKATIDDSAPDPDCVLMEYRTAGDVVVIGGNNDSSESSDESSDNEADDNDTNTKINKALSLERDASPDRDRKVKLNRHGFEDVRTKGELLPEEMPPLEELTITVDETVEMGLIGTIKSVVGVLVVIQCEENVPPLDDDTILFVEGHKVLGQVFEVFGPVKAPWYSVRFNDIENIASKGLEVGMPVFCAPKEESFTKYVFMDSLKKIKGSDASWEDNNEPPEKHLEFSDDEQEKRAKSKRKNRKTKETCNTEGNQNQGEKRSKTAGHQNQAWPPREPQQPRPHHNRPQDRSRNPFQGNSTSMNRPMFAGRQSYNGPRNGMNQTGDANQSSFSQPPPCFGGPPNFQNRPMFENQNRMPLNSGQPNMGPHQFSNNATTMNGNNQNVMFGNRNQTQYNSQNANPMFRQPVFSSPPPSMVVNGPPMSGPPPLLPGTGLSNMPANLQQSTPNQHNMNQFGNGPPQVPFNVPPPGMPSNPSGSFMMGNNSNSNSFQNINNMTNREGRQNQPKRFQVHGLNPGASSNSEPNQSAERYRNYDQIQVNGSNASPYGQTQQGPTVAPYRSNEQPNPTMNCDRTYNNAGNRTNQGEMGNYMSQDNNRNNGGQNWPSDAPNTPNYRSFPNSNNIQNNGLFQNSNHNNSNRTSQMGSMFNTQTGMQYNAHAAPGSHTTGGIAEGNRQFPQNVVLDQRYIQNN